MFQNILQWEDTTKYHQTEKWITFTSKQMADQELVTYSCEKEYNF